MFGTHRSAGSSGVFSAWLSRKPQSFCITMPGPSVLSVSAQSGSTAGISTSVEGSTPSATNAASPSGAPLTGCAPGVVASGAASDVDPTNNCFAVVSFFCVHMSHPHAHHTCEATCATHSTKRTREQRDGWNLLRCSSRTVGSSNLGFSPIPTRKFFGGENTTAVAFGGTAGSG